MKCAHALATAALVTSTVLAASPSSIHNTADPRQALASVEIEDQVPCLIASADPACRAELRDLGFLGKLQNRDDLRVLLLAEDSAPELKALLNLTACNDLAFVPTADLVSVTVGALGDAPTNAAAEPALAPSTPVHLSPTSSRELDAMVHAMLGLSVAFCNSLPFAVKGFWLDDRGAEVFNMRLAARECSTIVSYKGHRFLFRGEKMKNMLGTVRVTKDQTFYTKDLLLSNGEETCSYPEEGFADDVAEKKRIEDQRAACHARRLGLNEDQPKWVPHLTPLGFQKSKVPPTLFAELQAFFKQNRHREVVEGWPIADCYVNFVDVPTTMVHLTDAMRTKIYDGFRPLLEEWIGGTPLTPTSLYGIRLYHTGAELYKHGDRLTTHAVSSIINLAQEDMGEPWPLQIHDHDGQEHTVWMEPGDAVYYESAAAIHGREIPLNGTMVNLFVHFRPLDWNYEYQY